MRDGNISRYSFDSNSSQKSETVMLLKGWLKSLWNRCGSQRRLRSRVSNRRPARCHVSELIGLLSAGAGQGRLFGNVERLEDRALLSTATFQSSNGLATGNLELD